MRTVEEHLSAILGALTPLPPLDLSLLEAQGGVLAEPVVAPVPLPPFDNSAMDGYAVVASDLVSAPVTLPVIGDVMAGDQGVMAIRPGICCRIMTGAPMPGGADAVVPVEWTDHGTVSVWIDRPAPAGNYVRRAGEDVRAGQTVLPEGTFLGATQLGMAAAVGRSRLLVRPKPRVVVLATGNELREPGTTLAPGQIWDSNSFMLTAAVIEAGGVGYRQAIVSDDAEQVLETIEDQLGRADIIITTGGVSMGARDIVKEVLSDRVTFTPVAMRPGRPQGFGLLSGGIPIFTLPGNPVSAYVSFQVFVRPALRALQGLPPAPLDSVTAALTQPVSSPEGIRQYLRGALSYGDDGYSVTPASAQGSHQMGSLSSSNVLISVPSAVTHLSAGSRVEVLRLPS